MPRPRKSLGIFDEDGTTLQRPGLRSTDFPSLEDVFGTTIRLQGNMDGLEKWYQNEHELRWIYIIYYSWVNRFRHRPTHDFPGAYWKHWPLALPGSDSPRELFKDIQFRGIEQIRMAYDSDSNMALFSAHLFLIMPDSDSAS